MQSRVPSFQAAVAFVSTALAASIAAPPAGRTEFLAGPALKSLVAGRHVFLKVPFGGEFPLRYGLDGSVDGSGEAVGLGKLVQPSDSGRWWVDGQKLCQKWKSWYDGKTFCFTVERTGASTIAWTRDDGYAGTARLGD